MKYGYSVLLGEIVPASDIDYDDCADEQITCPECHEPTFKVAGSARASAHLSHYRKRDDDLVCELRVNSLTADEVEARNSISRGQTREGFFELLRELVMSRATGETGRHVRAFLRHKELHWLVDDLLDSIATREDTRAKLREMTGQHARQFGELLEGGLLGRFRHRIAVDMIDMLMATARDSGMKHVLALGFARMAERARRHVDGEPQPRMNDWDARAILMVLELVNTSRQKALRVIDRMITEKMPTDEGPTTPFETFRFNLFVDLPMTVALLDYNTMVPRLQAVMGRRAGSR